MVPQTFLRRKPWLGGGVVSKPDDPVKDGYSFVNWMLNGEAYDFNIPVNSDIVLVANFEEVVVGITLTHTEGSGAFKINNQWNGNIIVNNEDIIAAGESKEYDTTISNSTIYKIAAAPSTFSKWYKSNAITGIVSADDVTVNTPIKFTIDVPDLTPFLIDGHIAGDRFFYYFLSNNINKITDGSFDTSKITEVGDRFFQNFIGGTGNISSFPSGSFDTSNIIKAGDYFFAYFCSYSKITSLPSNSFKLDSMKEVGSNFFAAFNNVGSLASLPLSSFQTDNITNAGSDFFTNFNAGLFGDATLMEGNRLVKIYAVNAMTNFRVGSNQQNIAQGSYAYVNGE